MAAAHFADSRVLMKCIGLHRTNTIMSMFYRLEANRDRQRAKDKVVSALVRLLETI